jgi:glucose-1-phosphate cytidylyltransferase
MELDRDAVTSFAEKPQVRQGWINGGFMVFEPEVLERIEGDRTVLERDVLTQLAAEGQLGAYRHDGFWQCMDTLRDVRALTALWESGSPPWVRTS